MSNGDSWILGDNEVLDIKLPGAHNRRNATLVVKTFEAIGITSTQQVLDTLAIFPGTDRRFERLADNLYTDYGHHPVEIAATLQLARELSEHVVLVYQPHQNVRQHEIRDQYTDTFVLAEHVYWLPTYLAREREDQPLLTPAELTLDITNKKDITASDLNSDLWNNIQQARKEGKLVLCMGAGTIDKWVRDLLKA
jgi:UDP-N-acetylmuramate--alanine ligase